MTAGSAAGLPGRTQDDVSTFDESVHPRAASGQWTEKTQTPSPVTLGGAARRPELDGWPESLPEPEVTVSFSNGSGVTTSVSINGEPVFEVRNPADDIEDTENDSFVSDYTSDESVHEAAEAWARNKHNEIADAVRAEAAAAFKRSQAGILAKATGQTPEPATDEQLLEAIEEGYTVANAARRDAEYATASIISRGVLAEYPEAHSISLSTSHADNGEYVSGAVVYNEAREQIGHYGDDEVYPAKGEERPGREFLSRLNDLEPVPENSSWAAFNVRPEAGFYDLEDAYTIDVRRAAAWAPGAEA